MNFVTMIFILGMSLAANASLESCKNESGSLVGETHNMVGPVFEFKYDGKTYLNPYISAVMPNEGSIQVLNDKIDKIVEDENGDKTYYVSRTVSISDNGVIIFSDNVSCVGQNFNSVEMINYLRDSQ